MDLLDYIEKGRGYIEQHPEVLAGVFAVLFVVNVVTFFVAGWRAERKFRGQGHQPIRFRERGASGYSNRSLLTRLGGASGVATAIWLRQRPESRRLAGGLR